MLIKQLSVFIQNSNGRLCKITKILADLKINMEALSIADTEDFGILRIIADDAEKAEKALRESGFTVKTTDVIGIAIPDTPGALNDVLSVIEKDGISVEYLYAFMSKNNDNAMVVLKVDDPKKALDVLEANGTTVI